MKKILSGLLCALIIISSLALTACQKENAQPEETTQPPHVHTFDEWKILREATKTEDGERSGVCECGETITETVYAFGSLGLNYTVNKDNETCTVAGIGNCTDEVIHIGKYIDGYKVVAVSDFAFYEETSITEIFVPDGVTKIGSNAFAGCRALIKIRLPDSVEYFGDFVFSNSPGLREITIPNGTTRIDTYSFNGCYLLTTLTLPNSIQSIGNTPFLDCVYLKTIRFNGTVAEWNAIEKHADWKNRIASCIVYCTDGEVK